MWYGSKEWQSCEKRLPQFTWHFNRGWWEEDNQLFQWVRPLHLDDEDGNPDPQIVVHVRETGIDVERVLYEEVHTNTFNLS